MYQKPDPCACCSLATLLAAPLLVSCSLLTDENQPTAQVPQLVAGNNAFAFDLYAKLVHAGAGENLVFSPYSITLALGMAYGGASGETATEMERVLHLAMPADEVHRAFAALQTRQKALFAPKGYELDVANAVWAQKGFAFQPAYLSLTHDKYGAGLEQIDFRTDPDRARQRINAWVEQRTRNKITNLLGNKAVDTETRLVLVNAAYLKSAWARQFSKSLTHADSFRVNATTNKPIPMMSQRGRFRFFEDNDLQCVELPLGTGGVSVTILLPRKVDGLPVLERTLTSELHDKLRMHLHEESVTVELPRFKIESAFSLTEALSELGMPSVFARDRADFSKIVSKPRLYFHTAAHKAYLNVDETGVEAAAATALAGKETTAAPPRLVFRADHPFFYAIRESASGSILFMGRVIDPGSAADSR